MRSASALPMRSPVSLRPLPARSIHSRPSGLTITSITVGIGERGGDGRPEGGAQHLPAAALRLLGGEARTRSAMAVALRGGGCVAVGLALRLGVGAARPLTRAHRPSAVANRSGLCAAMVSSTSDDEPVIRGEAPADLGDEHLEALRAEQRVPAPARSAAAAA